MINAVLSIISILLFFIAPTIFYSLAFAFAGWAIASRFIDED